MSDTKKAARADLINKDPTRYVKNRCVPGR